MASQLNLQDAIAEFGKNLNKRPISDNTRKAFWGDVNIFARYLTPEDDKPVPVINTVTAENIRDFLTHEEQRPKANSPKSLERRLTSLKVFFAWLKDAGHLGFDPAEGIAYKPFLDPLPEFLSAEEQIKAIESARHVAAGERLDTRPLVAILLVLDTGMKKGECLKLVWDDVDLDRCNVLIKYDKKHLEFKNRRLPISDDCVDALKHHFSRFDIASGKPLFDCTGRNLEYIFNRKVAPLAGLSALTFEMLRWSCALSDFKLGELSTEQFEIKYGLSALGWAEMEAKLERIVKSQA
jgi:integrase/recombinase XerD